MARPATLLSLVIAAVALVAPAAYAAPASGAAAKRVSTIKLVSPMRALVGKTITIRGTGFSSSRRRNTVIFRAPDKRTAFAKPRRAWSRKLRVVVPASLERLIKKRDTEGGSKGVPTRFRLRIVVGRGYGRLSARRNSPVILSSLGTGNQADCGKGTDFDRDLISNALEESYKTDPCNADTDGDGVEDGFEQQSARDLNQRAVPYSGKRPFANALDPSDPGHDYDGDGLSNIEEFRAWAHAPTSPAPSLLQSYTGSPQAPAFGGPYGGGSTFGGHTLPMNYSDGDQSTVDVRPGHPEYRDYLDFGGGQMTDDERDVDGDGLRNIDEIRLLMWQAYYPPGKDCGYEYRPILPRVFQDPDYLETDSDGDGVWDGSDDQDTDGVSNVDEVQPPFLAPGDTRYEACKEITPLPADGARDGSTTLRHPFNPCLPYVSDTCRRYGVRD